MLRVNDKKRNINNKKIEEYNVNMKLIQLKN